MAKYLDGRNIKKTTEDLTNLMWGSVLPAIIGSTMATTGPVIWGVAWFMRKPWARDGWLFPTLVIVGVVFGIGLSLPFFVWEGRLRRHTRMMNEETRKSGKGWASS